MRRQAAGPSGTARSSARPPPGIPWAALIASTVLVLVSATAATVVLEARATLRAERNAADVVRSVERRMERYVVLLRGTAALFAYDQGVDRAGFHRFVQRLRLEEHPGIQGIGWSQRLLPGEAEQVVADAHRTGEESFHLWPEHEGERHAIVFLEPTDVRNHAALGFDMHGEETRRAAMDRARDTGRPAATSIVRLVQELGEGDQPGLLIYAPVYDGGAIPTTVEERRTRLRGFAYAAFRAGDLFRGIFAEGIPAPALSIDDGPVSDPAARLFTHEPSGRTSTAHVSHVVVAGRPWTIEVRAPADVVSDRSVVAGVIVLVGALFTLILLNLDRTHRRAETERAVAAAIAVEARQGQLRETFLGVLGHDLRNPLGAAKAGTQLLLADETLAEKQRRGLERIRRSVERAIRLVEQLLDLTRVRLGSGLRVDVRPLPLAPLVREVVEEARLAHERGPELPVELALDETLVVLADSDRLAQILSNLTGNALTHGEPPIRLTARTHAGLAEVEVANRGAPIPPDALETLFDPFARGEGAREGGLGLGLFISRQLALAHGGTLEVRSDADHGTRFLLRLPLA